jgi:chromate transport protein ChrA
MAKRKPRCKCHHKDRPKGVILICDAILAAFIGLCVVVLLVYVVLPYYGVHLDLSVVTRSSLNGLWVAIIGVVLNVLWAIYYGCQKSLAGAGLSIVTALTVANSYGMFGP